MTNRARPTTWAATTSRFMGLVGPAAWATPARFSTGDPASASCGPVNPATGGSPGPYTLAAGASPSVRRRTVDAPGLLPLRPEGLTRPPAGDRALQRVRPRQRTTSRPTHPGLHGAVVLPGEDGHAEHALERRGRGTTRVESVDTDRRLEPQHLPAGRATRTTRSTRRTLARGSTSAIRHRRPRHDYETNTQRYLAGVKGTNYGWDWDMAGLYIRSETDVDPARVSSSTTGCSRASPAPARTAITVSAASRESQQPGDLRLAIADPDATRITPRTPSSTPRARATSTSSTAGRWRWRSATSSQGRGQQPGRPGHRHRQHRRPRLFGGDRLARRQRAVRRVVRARSSRTSS